VAKKSSAQTARVWNVCVCVCTSKQYFYHQPCEMGTPSTIVTVHSKDDDSYSLLLPHSLDFEYFSDFSLVTDFNPNMCVYVGHVSPDIVIISAFPHCLLLFSPMGIQIPFFSIHGFHSIFFFSAQCVP